MTITKMIDFPTTKVRACIAKDPDGDIIFLNSRFASNAIRKSYDHEISHLESDDLYKDVDATMIEASAHVD